MKKPVYSMLFMVLWINMHAQFQWFNPLPQGNGLNGVSFGSTSHGVAVGDYGTAMITSDGGNTWLVKSTGIKKSLSAVHMITSQIGWAVGNDGMILYTSNGGETWQGQNSGTTEGLNSIYFADNQHGWAAGQNGTILYTSDGGNSWGSGQTNTTNNIFGVSFANDQFGWAVGPFGTIMHSSDGGVTWSAQTSGTVFPLTGVCFLDPKTGWVSGGLGTILQTSDGGNSWQAQNSGTGAYLHNIAFSGSLNGYASGSDGSILHTTDGGSTWNQANTNWGLPVQWVSIIDGTDAIAVGQGGTIQSTTNGNTWTPKSSGFHNNIQGMAFTDDQHAWAVCKEGIIIYTDDGGHIWYPMESPTNEDLNRITMASSTTGSIAGNNGTILFFEQQENKWKKSDIQDPDQVDIHDIAISKNNPAIQYAAGETGKVYYSDDAGRNWYPVTTPTNKNLKSVSCSELYKLWAVGEEGTIIYSGDGGQNWETQNSGTTANLNAVRFKNNNEGVAAGSSGTILSTSNGGNQWNPNTKPDNYLYYEIYLRDNDYRSDKGTSWYICGSGGVFMFKHEGTDQDWESFPTGTSNNLYCVQFLDEYHGYLAGDYGTLLYTDDGGGTVGFIEHCTMQAHDPVTALPNPFTNSVNIRLVTQPESEYQMAICDSEGKQVYSAKIITNSSGYAQFTWQPEGFPAGVYYCTVSNSQEQYTLKLIYITW